MNFKKLLLSLICGLIFIGSFSAVKVFRSNGMLVITGLDSETIFLSPDNVGIRRSGNVFSLVDGVSKLS